MICSTVIIFSQRTRNQGSVWYTELFSYDCRKLLRDLDCYAELKISHQFFYRWESKPKVIASCTRDFSSASCSKLAGIPIAPFATIVIARTVIWKPLSIFRSNRDWACVERNGTIHSMTWHIFKMQNFHFVLIVSSYRRHCTFNFFEGIAATSSGWLSPGTSVMFQIKLNLIFTCV